MTTDAWGTLETRPMTEIEHAHWAGELYDFSDVSECAITFVRALSNPVDNNLEFLRLIVTPESRDSWGDFSEASRRLRSIPDFGMGARPTVAFGDPLVRYATIFSNVKEAFVSLDDQVVIDESGMVVSLVWRPSFGMWLVHAMGDPVLPEAIPHDNLDDSDSDT